MRYCSNDSAEDRVREIILKFSPAEEYIVYGTGECYQFMQWIFGNLLKVRFCVDQKARLGVYQIGKETVYAPEKLQGFKSSKIIIAANGEYYFEIKENLIKHGHREELLCSAFEIVAVWGMQYKKEIISMYVSFPVLSACTLNCKGCIHYTQYHKKPFLLQIGEIINSIDTYFQCVDFVDQIQIFGGEPFIHKDIGEICLYISEHYATRYHKMFVTTNGTVIPKEKDMECLRRCTKLVVSISDYSRTNEDRLSIDGLIENCNQKGIAYSLNSNFYRSDSENLWFDCGDPNQKRAETNVRQRFSDCTLSGCGVYRNRYYYCPNSMFANITDIYPEGRDYLDLEQMARLSDYERGTKLLAWHLGFIKEGKLDFCSYCAGFGKKVNTNYIKAGEQL